MVGGRVNETKYTLQNAYEFAKVAAQALHPSMTIPFSTLISYL